MNRAVVDPATIRDQCLCLHLRRAARAIARQHDLALAPVELSNGQFSLIALVAGFHDIAFQALADELAMDRTTLTAMLKPLVRRGLVAVDPDVRDRRARRITLTVDGAALFREAALLWKKVQDTTTSSYGLDQADRLRRQLRKLP